MKKKLSCLIFAILLIGLIESITVCFFLISHKLPEQASIVAFIILFLILGFFCSTNEK